MNMKKLTRKEQEKILLAAFREKMEESLNNLKEPYYKEFWIESILLHNESLRIERKMSKRIYDKFKEILLELKETIRK